MQEQYYAIFGMVAICLCTIVGVGISILNRIKENTQEQQKPINNLNESIMRLTYEINHMRTDGKVRDKRLDKHGSEIDEIKEENNAHKIELRNHESRITALEKK